MLRNLDNPRKHYRLDTINEYEYDLVNEMKDFPSFHQWVDWIAEYHRWILVEKSTEADVWLVFKRFWAAEIQHPASPGRVYSEVP